MKWRSWLAGLGLVGIAVAVPACSDDKGTKEPVQQPPGGGRPPDQAAATSPEVKALRDSLATLLKQGNDPKENLNQWLKDLAQAVCQLEQKMPPNAGLDPAKRICPAPGGGPDKTSPPSFPPN